MTRAPNVIPTACGRCGYFTRTGVVQGKCRFYNVVRLASAACIAAEEKRPVAGAETAHPRDAPTATPIRTEALLSSDALFEKGESMIRAGDPASAVAFFRQMLTRSQSEGTSRRMLDRLYNLSAAIHSGAVSLNAQAGGSLYFSAGLAELDAEIAVMELLLEYEPKAADAWSGLGLAYDNRGHCEKAEQCYRRAIELDPRGPCAGDAWMNIGVLYMAYAKTVRVREGGGEEREAPIAGLRKEQLFPTSGTHVAISMNMESPHWRTAEAAFEQALSIFSALAAQDAQFRTDLVRVHWNLAELYTDLFQGSKAIPHVQEVCRLDPGNQKAVDWLKAAERNTGRTLLG